MEFIMSLTQFVVSAHPYVQALVILGTALVAALVILPFVAGFVRYLTRKTETDVDDQIISALNTPIVYFVVLVGASFSLPLLALPPGVESVAGSIIKTLFVLVVGQAIFRVVRILLDGAVRSERLTTVNAQTAPLFKNLSLIVIGAAVLYGLFIVWGIDVTAWLASAGIIGIAVGFAAKDTLSNIIAGVFILADKPYSVGDFVELGSGETGIVESIGLRSTRIVTFSDAEVTIPNTVIANEAIINKSTGPDTGRVNLDIGVAYGTDVEKVKKLLLGVANDHEKVLDDPEPAVFFTEFADSSLNFRLACRVRDPLDVYGTKSELRFIVDDLFRKENIEIPFPQRDVNLKK